LDLQLKYYPEDREILTTTCQPVLEFTRDKFEIAFAMDKLLSEVKGAGLAAPQVGILERIIVVRLKEKGSIFMLNPLITRYSDHDRQFGPEGCLSIPGIEIRIRRPVGITVEYQRVDGMKTVMPASGWDARVIQHEIDHLNGKLILDHVASKVLRKEYEQKSRKWRSKNG
jgi:peptide deformylase